MVLPDYIVEAVDRLPGDDGWGQIRAYLDAGGDVNDVDANGKTILCLHDAQMVRSCGGDGRDENGLLAPYR